ncbi:MAG: ATP-binding protein [Desulfobacterales bacterium]|jgi:signal transduction histidine kinase|nr:ATP-binding protein [Desulfobacterales bacterium]
MRDPSSEDKGKPYRLVKYFTFSSLVVIFIGALILSVLFTHGFRTVYRNKSEDYARLLIENLNHQVFYQFNIPVAWRFEKIQLRNKEQFELMDNVVRNTLHSFNVDMVNIYNMSNVISYSFDTSLVGRENAGGTGYQQAVEGLFSSKLVQRGSFFEILIGAPKEVKMVTFAPLRAESPTLIFLKGKGFVFSPLRMQQPENEHPGPILGVFEIVQNLSDDYKTIFRFQKMVVIACTTVMGLLFLVLRFVVKRGEGILESRAQERLRLKEQLSRAARLSALGELTAGISHEIRNPLGIIRSSAELLKKKMAKFDPANQIPNIIVEEANRLNAIITDFLNYAKPNPPNLTSIRIESVIEKNISFLSAQLKDKQIHIQRQYADQLPEILADSSMLYQAFLNILINAMQAMTEGGTIDVSVETVNNTGVQIAIRDEGQGIPESAMENIWDPFFTTKDTGTGLGLGIVKNIIESHGGDIIIENRPVKGAQVTITLPLKQGES